MNPKCLALQSIVELNPKLDDLVTVSCTSCKTVYTKKFKYVIKCCRNRNSTYFCRRCSNRLIQSSEKTRTKIAEKKKENNSHKRNDQLDRFEKFVNKANDKYDNKYDYSKAKYTRINYKIEIICPIHGSFWQTPDSHLRINHGCPKCGSESSKAIQSIKKSLKLDEFISKANRIHGDYDYNNAVLSNCQNKIEIICPTHGSFWQTPNKHIHGQKPNGYPKCSTVVSREHDIILNLLRNHNINFILNDKEIINPYELDIYIPDYNLAIEINGCYWHGVRVDNYNLHNIIKNRHAFKYDLCSNKNIQLLQFWDYEINNYLEIVENIILSKLNIVGKIYARECTITKLGNNTTNNFFNKSHLQGHRNANVIYGLLLENDIQCALSISKHPKFDWEIIRFANKLNHKTIGGFSRLLKRFIKDYNPKQILTFADRRISTGNVYMKNGFEYFGSTSPNYFYYNRSGLLSRQQCQKNKLHRFLESYDETKSETMNMLVNNYVKVFDAGHHKFVMNFN